VRDNGVLQQVDVVAFDSLPVNVVFVLDVSASMSGPALDQLKAAGKAVIQKLKRDDRAGLVTFNHVVDVRQPLTADRDALLGSLEWTQALGETSLVDAAHAGIMVGESDIGRALVVIFSDGVDTTSWLSPAAVLRSARRTDSVVYSVSATVAGESPVFLKDLCDTTGGRLLEVASTEQLTPALLEVLQEFRHRYVVSFTPRGVSRDGWHPLAVRVKNRRATVRARPGYLASPRAPTGTVLR
jgi:Ca-activated chloride channel homolog